MRRFLTSTVAIAAISIIAAVGFAASANAAASPEQVLDVDSLAGAFLAGRIAESENDLGATVEYYTRALSFDPDNRQLQQSLMLALIASGRFDESLKYAEKLKAVPEVERVSRLALGIDAMRKKDYVKTQEWMQLALESDLDKLIVNLISAWAKQGEGKTDAALKQLADLQGPDWYRVFRNYHSGLIAEAAGKTSDAEKNFTTAMDDIDAGAAAPDAYLRSAEAYAGMLERVGRKDDALKVLDRADEFSPNRVQLKALRAKIEKGEAVAPLVGDPLAGASEVLLNLGMALNRGGGEPFVRLYLQLALAAEPENDFALMNLAEVEEQQKNPQGAIDLYGRVPDASPFKRMAEMQLGLNLADLEKKDDAVKHLKAVLEQNRDDMRAYLSLGGVYASMQDYRSAAALYDEAVERLKPPVRADWNVFYQRGIAHERQKEWEKAEASFKKALELYPDQPQVLNYLGYSWIDMDRNLDEGLALIQKAADQRPSDGYIIDSLGWAFYKLGRFDDAVRELERAVNLKPDDAVLNDHLGDAYWRAGRKLEATFQWAHARDLKPEPDVLAGVKKKLAEGMPPLDKKAEAPAPATPVQTAQAMAAPAAKPEQVSYTVQPGQSLWSIAAEKLGSGERYIEIIRLNPELSNPARLAPGVQIKLPGG